MPRSRCSVSTQLQMKTCHPLEIEDESGRRLCEYWCSIFQALDEGEKHHCHETIFRYVQKAPDDIRWKITTKNPLQVLMGFRMASTGVREAWVLSFSTTRTNMWLRVAQFWRNLPRAELFSFPSPPMFRCRQQWPYCEIAGSTASVDTV